MAEQLSMFDLGPAANEDSPEARRAEYLRDKFYDEQYDQDADDRDLCGEED